MASSEARACAVCDGTGWKLVDASGSPRVVRCDCWRANVAARLMAGARIPRRYHHCTLAGFVTYGNEWLETAVAKSRRLVDAFPVVDQGLLYEGPPGVGKTHLAVATLMEIVRTKGARGVFYDTRDLLRVIRNTYDPVSRTSEVEVLRPVIDADLLVLDDLGAEKTSEWVEETLNLIVNSRYNERRVTIFTSNYKDEPDITDPDTLLCRVGVRMYSRLHEMCEFLRLEGADYRELPVNGGAEDLRSLWKTRRRPGRRGLPARSGQTARAQLRGEAADLKWPGGRAGS